MATLSVAKTVTKVGIAVGAVAVTANQGVWSTNNENGVKSLNKVKSTVLHSVNEDLVQKVRNIDRQTVKIGMESAWNSGMKKTFSAVYSAPEKSYTYVKKYVDQIKNSKS